MIDERRLNGQRETLVTLRDLFEEQIDHERELREGQHKAHEREHTIAERALDLSAELARQTKTDSNEWRAAMLDRERTFTTKNEADALGARLTLLERADISRTTREAERERSTVRTMALIGLAATVVSVVLGILIRLGT